MILLREELGEELRRLRTRQGRTLREVSAAARVSLGYLSEVERGQKEASSELLAAICSALEVPLSDVLDGVASGVRAVESGARRVEQPVTHGAKGSLVTKAPVVTKRPAAQAEPVVARSRPGAAESPSVVTEASSVVTEAPSDAPTTLASARRRARTAPEGRVAAA